MVIMLNLFCWSYILLPFWNIISLRDTVATQPQSSQWKPSCLCEDESSGPPSSALHFLFPLSIALCVRTVAETSPHFIFTAGGCLFFLGLGFFFFLQVWHLRLSSFSQSWSPAPLFSVIYVCMCVELPIFEEGQIWECRRFFKIAFPLSLLSNLWVQVRSYAQIADIKLVCLCVRARVGGKLEGMFVWTPPTVYKRFTWPLWHYPVVLNSGFWSFNVSPLADDMLGFLKPEVTVVVSETIDLSSTPYSLL